MADQTAAQRLEGLLIQGWDEEDVAWCAVQHAVETEFDVSAADLADFPAFEDARVFDVICTFKDGSQLAIWVVSGAVILREANAAAESMAHEAWMWDGLGYDGQPAC